MREWEGGSKREGDMGEKVLGKGIGWEARKEKREDERVGSWEAQRG
jgi:hypothetical protein